MKISRCFRNDNYLKFIRTQKCVIDNHNYNIHAHHVRIDFYGQGIKPSDYRAIPLSAIRHDELHRFGEKSFFKKYKICPNSLIWAYMNLYVLEQGEIGNESINYFEDIIDKIANHQNR